jgi:hypothetical protein
MAKNEVSKRKPGRPTGRVQNRPFIMRATDDFVGSLDEWRNRQPDKPSRSEALRRLTAAALEAELAKKNREK